MEQTGAVASVATSFDTDVHFVFGLYKKEKNKKKRLNIKKPFHSQDLVSNNHCSLACHSYVFRAENLVLDQLSFN